jgi:hypothetical protein
MYKLLILLFVCVVSLTACSKTYYGAIGSYTCSDAQHLKAYVEAKQVFELSPHQGFDYWYGNAIKRNCEEKKDEKI